MIFHCPYPAALSHDVERARTHTLAWAQEIGIIISGDATRRMDAYRLDMYSARICPSATGAGLDLLNDWVVWGTLLDDRFETRDPDAIRFALDQMMAMLHQDSSSGLPRGVHPFTVGLSDLWGRTRELMTDAPRHRTVTGLIRWLETYAQDAVIRRDGVWLTFEQYLAHRLWTGAVPAYMELTEAVVGCSVPDSLRNLDVVSELYRTSSEHVCIINDVYGVEREESRGDIGNALLVLEHHEGWQRDRSIREAEHLANHRMSTFLALEKQLMVTAQTHNISSEADPTTIEDMIQGLRSWIRGNLDWHRNVESQRYEERGLVAENSPRVR